MCGVSNFFFQLQEEFLPLAGRGGYLSVVGRTSSSQETAGEPKSLSRVVWYTGQGSKKNMSSKCISDFIGYSRHPSLEPNGSGGNI